MPSDAVTDSMLGYPFEPDDEEYVLCNDCREWIGCPDCDMWGYCREGDEFTKATEGCWR